MKRLFALCFLLSACCFGQAADRLSFTNHAPQVAPEAFARMTNAATYYSTNRLPWNSNNVIPVATCGNLPLGSLSRRVWARVLYPNSNGPATMNQRDRAAGAVRFYRGGALVGSLPYASGGSVPTQTNGNYVVDARPMLFGEMGTKATLNGGTENYQWANLATARPSKMLAVELDFNNTAIAIGLEGLDVSIDCDAAKFEIDSLDLLSGNGLDTYCEGVVIFLAVLSQPPP